MSFLSLGLTEAQPAIVGAGFWIRFLARALDTIYGFLFGYIAGFTGGVALAILQAHALVTPGWHQRLVASPASRIVLSLLGAVLYHTFCEGLSGASLGKLMCGLRVLSDDLTPCRLRPALIRSLAYYVDGLVFGVVAYLSMDKTPMRQRHGDHWAHTVVVKNSQAPETSKPSDLRLLAALAAGSSAWVLSIFVGVVWAGY